MTGGPSGVLPEAARRFVDSAVPAVPPQVTAALGLGPRETARGEELTAGPEGWAPGPVEARPSSVAEALARAGTAALAEAIALPPGERDAAFRLLAADALLTWACEAAAGAPDPRAMLERVLEQVADG